MIEIKDLAFSYGNVPVLKSITKRLRKAASTVFWARTAWAKPRF